MESRVAEDRRVFQRFPINLPAVFTLTDTRDNTAVETFDISAQGIGLCTPGALMSGTELEMSFKLPATAEAFPVHGTVIWSRKIRNGFRTGIRFNHAELMEVSTILRILYSRQAN